MLLFKPLLSPQRTKFFTQIYRSTKFARVEGAAAGKGDFVVLTVSIYQCLNVENSDPNANGWSSAL